eukprot:9821492-Heterocapsa_arctica.AAC.1
MAMSRRGEWEQEGVRTLLHGWGHWKQESRLQKVTCRSGLSLIVNKCYDNIPIQSLLTEGTKHGQIGRLVALAVHQYTGPRR